MKLKQSGKRTVRRFAALTTKDRGRCEHGGLYTKFSGDNASAFGEVIVGVYCVDCGILVYEERVYNNETRYDPNRLKRRIVSAARSRMAFKGV